jgi:hypothetical protein
VAKERGEERRVTLRWGEGGGCLFAVSHGRGGGSRQREKTQDGAFAVACGKLRVVRCCNGIFMCVVCRQMVEAKWVCARFPVRDILCVLSV